MINDFELEMLRTNTLAYIDADATQVILNRRTRTSDGAGGFVLGSPVPLPAQVFRLVVSNVQQTVARSVDGQEVSADYMMICPWNADVVERDTFVADDYNYKVIFILPHTDNDYQIVAEVSFHGSV